MSTLENAYFLAVDIGASSGRHILGWVEEGLLRTEEIYRFPNRMVPCGGSLCWDYEELFREILCGMCRCAELGKIPQSMGVDTWGVDFVLLDEKDAPLGRAFAYRDKRTEGMAEAVYRILPETLLYQRTGIQRQSFNTIFQLYSVLQSEPALLSQARRLLMTPDYFHFLLTGEKTNEYTIATTSQLVNAETRGWDNEILSALGLPRGIFGELLAPGSRAGCLRPEVRRAVGFDCEVILPASHDTASAVLAAPMTGERAVYLSSGTWSLMGVERAEPDCGEQSRLMNFTNEGGYGGTYRYLKNIMGLWILQSARKELHEPFSFDALCALAEKERDFPARIDVDDHRFLAPEHMTSAIRDYCRETAQPAPETTGQLFSCIYQSLAESYGKTVREIERATGAAYERIHIVGGGSKDTYLNALTAERTGMPVAAGPAEATGIGNLLAQMLRAGVFCGVGEARAVVGSSFPIKQVRAEGQMKHQ